MEFITTLSIQLIVCVVLIHQSICGPPRYRRFRIPDPNEGVGCQGDLVFGEYCDKYSSGQIKKCSPCSLSQLRNPDIAFPEECANMPCPWRCPEHISDHTSPAPSNSCDLTTTSLTTQEATTDAPTTYASTPRAPTSAPTPAALSTTTSSSQSTRPTNPPGNSAMPVTPIVLGIIFAVIAAIGMAFLAFKCVKRYRCKRAVTCTTSPSSEPMMATNDEIEMSPSQTPTTPMTNPGQTSEESTSQESDMFVKLGCSSGRDHPIPVGPDSLPSTSYRAANETLQENPDVGRCNFTLHNLMTHIENNSRDFQLLKALFGHITTTNDRTILRALSRVLGVTSLTDVDGLHLFEEIISIDSQLKEEENSCSVYSILQAFRADNQRVPVPDYVADICRKLSSIHEDCLSCRHLVCQVRRNSTETTV